MCRAVKAHLVDCIPVGFDYTLNTVALWIEDVTIKSEAVVGCLKVGWDRGTETECRYLFICVIVLQNAAHTLYRIVVFVLFDVTSVVERGRFAWVDV